MRPAEFDAAGWDEGGALPAEVRDAVARAGWFGVDLPTEHGGRGGSQAELGELCAEIGAVCSSVRALVTVQGMVSAAIARWGTDEQRSTWLPALAAGEHLAGFAATESGAGTELSAVDTRFERTGGEITVTGEKRWVTFGQEATVFLVLGKLDGRLAAVLVEKGAGVSTDPVRGQLGLRAAMVAHVRFDGVRVPVGNLVASPGFGLSHVIATALDHGRFTVAWGCAGMAAACVADVADHTVRRRQDAVPLAAHQLVRSMLARMAVDATAARELCLSAARARDAGEPGAVAGTVMAKYAAARAAASASQDAVQLLGSAGCASDSRVGRFFRDAKVMQIIEGSDQVSELHIADHLLREHRVGGKA
ncbi:acyl-CoA dehydrogenase family protein [Umezawaea tangerina]|uniref:Alkylation response protein AidB-like acyl-CoA dehydrogenase n=1 Tax=Umezawaea tangerina TaxID=84725 RepID=A0A2T0T7G2_9PSEU|nr:acyl-CoA dehydrogenase family protein [Umezawaea tangerina]PRY41578.1 alkylation response protein AidB-like acyl-CoA dehydrogenase [Umezawaea tangerina]